MPKLLQTCPLRRATDGENHNQWFPATDLAQFERTSCTAFLSSGWTKEVLELVRLVEELDPKPLLREICLKSRVFQSEMKSETKLWSKWSLLWKNQWLHLMNHLFEASFQKKGKRSHMWHFFCHSFVKHWTVNCLEGCVNGALSCKNTSSALKTCYTL